MPATTRPLTSRRAFLAGAAALVLLGLSALPAAAQQAVADSFVKSFADQLVAVVNGPGSQASKQQALGPLIDASVDVPTIARFCLGPLLDHRDSVPAAGVRGACSIRCCSTISAVTWVNTAA